MTTNEFKNIVGLQPGPTETICEGEYFKRKLFANQHD